MCNSDHLGVYDPRYALFEYADKINILKNSSGEELTREVWGNGGNINKISLVDPSNKTKFVMAGPGSEEWADLEVMQMNFLAKLLLAPENFNVSDNNGNKRISEFDRNLNSPIEV